MCKFEHVSDKDIDV